MKYYAVRIVDENWRTDHVVLCDETQLDVVKSLGFYNEIKEIDESKYNELIEDSKNVKGMYGYDKFLEYFSCFPTVSNKLKEDSDNT